jgi:hypothetical protein
MLAERKRVGEETGVSNLETIATGQLLSILDLSLNFNSESVKFEMDFNSS